MADETFDSIGEWSEDKLNILKEYAKPYMQIIDSHPPLYPIYIDAFADRGKHISRKSKTIIAGSPLNALRVEPRFKEYYFIDIIPEKVETLRGVVENELSMIERPKPIVKIIEGDGNKILREDLLPGLTYDSYRRALCFLDPYGMHLEWDNIKTAGGLGTIDIFINFSIMDMNMNVLRLDPENVEEREIQRMNLFWGDESWKNIAYDTNRNLFGYPEKVRNEDIKNAYRKRLREVAGFLYVPEPIAMCNSTNTIIYYLFFASSQLVARKIIEDIFNKYRRGN